MNRKKVISIPIRKKLLKMPLQRQQQRQQQQQQQRQQQNLTMEIKPRSSDDFTTGYK